MVIHVEVIEIRQFRYFLTLFLVICYIFSLEPFCDCSQVVISAVFGLSNRLGTPNKIKVDGKTLEADEFIIATGSSLSIPRFKGIENVDYLTNNEALSLKEKPSSMIVVGGSALGLEFAQMYAQFGTKITLLQRSDKMILEHEPEIADELHNYLTEEGVEIATGVNVLEVYQKGNSKFLSVLLLH